MKNRIIAIILIVLAITLAVVSYLLLPATVATQISITGEAANKFPKLIAILIPTAFSLGGGIGCLVSKDDIRKPVVISLIGIGIFIIMLVTNLK